MRTNIDIDDDLLSAAMQAGAFATKKETVEAGLRLLARQAAYREVLKWRGQLKWEGDEAIDWVKANQADELSATPRHRVQERQMPLGAYTNDASATAQSPRKGQRRVGR